MELEDGAPLAADLLLGVGVHEESEHYPVRTHRGLDDVGNVALAGSLVEVGEVLAGVLLVFLQVIIGAVGDPFELRPAGEREVVLDVHAANRVVRPFLVGLLPPAEVLFFETEAQIPVEALLDPVLVPFGIRAWLHEELHLHLLELARAEYEVARCDLVPERLPDLGDPERYLDPAGLQDVLEVDEDPLRRLGPKVRDVLRALYGPGVGLEHQVEGAHGRKIPAAVHRVFDPIVALDDLGQLIWAQSLDFLPRGRLDQVVGPVASSRTPALDEHVVEACDVPGGLPNFGVHDDGGVYPHDVVAHVDHAAPPLLFYVPLHLDAQRPVVVGGADAAVDLGALVHEAPALAERDYLLHRNGLRHLNPPEFLGTLRRDNRKSIAQVEPAVEWAPRASKI